VVRLFSVYGPWEARHRLVPQAIRAALTGEELPLTGPELRRDFVFVDDVVDACLRAASVDAALGEAINIGTGVETANEELVAEVERVIGKEVRTRIGAYSARETDSAHWRADISKAKRLLGWEPRYTLAAGLARTAAWMESLPGGGIS
jgi:nucleoside-diphosphate-sugar epimerase